MNRLKIIFGLFVFIFLLAGCSREDSLEQRPNVENDPSESLHLSEEEAKDLLLSFIGEEVKTKSNSVVTISKKNKLLYNIETPTTDPVTRSHTTQQEVIPIYEFNVEEDGTDGFALVIGDKRINSVLAYVPEGSLSDTTFIGPLADYMRSVPEFLQESINSIQEEVLTRMPPEEIYPPLEQDNKDTLRVFMDGFDLYYSCYVLTKWGQGNPYNREVPFICSDGGRAYAGCVPIAIAQLMAYHKKSQEFNWNLLLSLSQIWESDPIEIKEEIGRLVAMVGKECKTIYGCKESPTYIKDGYNALTNLGFKSTFLAYAAAGGMIPVDDPYYRCSDCIEHYKEKIINSIKNKKPCLAFSANHAYLLDAYGYKNYPVEITINGVDMRTYQTSHYYHLNMGWYGGYDGWYLAYSGVFYRKSYYNNINFVHSGHAGKGFIVDIE